jgi:hypothetical protein
MCLLAHEMGHAVDPFMQENYALIDQLYDQAINGDFSSFGQLKEMLLLSERNAWIYGERFIDRFVVTPLTYNELNDANYRQLESMLNGLEENFRQIAAGIEPIE